MSPRGNRTGKVARVLIEPPQQPDLFRDPEDRVRSAFVPGTSVTRYGRTWLMEQVRELDGFLHGRIGFEAEDGVAEVWDPTRTDFTPVAIPSGVTSPFALRLSDLLMAFQTRGAIIKVNTFVGAMQALLRQSTGENWSLRTSQSRIEFPAWRQSVDRIVRARFHLEGPNPNYEGRPFVEELLESLSAAAGKVEVVNSDGLDTDTEVLTQLLDHVERGYGDATSSASVMSTESKSRRCMTRDCRVSRRSTSGRRTSLATSRSRNCSAN